MKLAGLMAALGRSSAAIGIAAATPAVAAPEALAGLSAEQQSFIGAAFDEGFSAAKAEGAKAERERIGAVLSHEKIKGSGKETAAVALAMKSPAMSADEIAEFVASHVGSAPAAEGGSATPSIEQRMQGQGADLSLGAPMRPAGGHTAAPKIDASSIYASRRTQMEKAAAAAAK